MKLSDKLVSRVLGCECEFYNITHNELDFYSKENVIDNTLCTGGLPTKWIHNLNLDTFIDIAVWNWAKQNKYYFQIWGDGLRVNNPKQNKLKYLPIKDNRKEAIIEALEWCVEEIIE